MTPTETTSAAPAGRLSTIELLRLLSMLMVLVLHADYVALKVPDAALFATAPGEAVGSVVAEQLSIVAVDVFVLISAWFGIRTTARGICSLLFQVLFYALVILGLYALFEGITPAQYVTAWHSLIPGYDHWFIRAYLGLMILAPVLNAFLERASTRLLRFLTFGYLLFEIIYDWLLGVGAFASGYSLQSLVGLYLLGSLARRERWQRLGSLRWAGIYLACALLSSAIALTSLANGAEIPPQLTAYDSPLVILGALSLLLAFAADTRQRNRLINALAASSLAVYLIHFNPFLFKHYQQICRQLYFSNEGIMVWLAMGGFLLAVFFGSILIDRLRLPLWQLLLRACTRRADTK